MENACSPTYENAAYAPCVTPEERRQVQQRIHILKGLAVAQEEAFEVVGLIFDSDDERDAMHRLMKRFDLDDVQALAVLDAQFRRVDRKNRARVTEELADRLRDLGL